MSRLARKEVFSSDEIAIVHVINRVVRRCFLLGDDPVSGKNYNHRRLWIEQLFQHFAGCFGIDLLAFAILSNHFHLILRSRPDVVATWDDSEVARRWLLLCPVRKLDDGSPAEPNQAELNTIRNDAARLAEVRSRLSDISWWMRLLCQKVATRANAEDGESGKFWQNRFRAVRILDEQALLACAAYVDLNPIRAALADSLEGSDYTSIQRHLQAARGEETASAADRYLSPLSIDERNDALGPCPSRGHDRCSDKGFLPISLADYLKLLDWTARQVGGRRRKLEAAPVVLERLAITPATWLELVGNFGRMFFHVAGTPQSVDGHCSLVTRRRFRLTQAARQHFATTA